MGVNCIFLLLWGKYCSSVTLLRWLREKCKMINFLDWLSLRPCNFIIYNTFKDVWNEPCSSFKHCAPESFLENSKGQTSSSAWAAQRCVAGGGGRGCGWAVSSLLVSPWKTQQWPGHFPTTTGTEVDWSISGFSLRSLDFNCIKGDNQIFFSFQRKLSIKWKHGISPNFFYFPAVIVFIFNI